MFCILKGHFQLILSYHTEIPFKSGLCACSLGFFSPPQFAHCREQPWQFSPLCLLWIPCPTWKFGILMFVTMQGACLILRLACIFTVGKKHNTRNEWVFKSLNLCQAWCQSAFEFSWIPTSVDFSVTQQCVKSLVLPPICFDSWLIWYWWEAITFTDDTDHSYGSILYGSIWNHPL